jgi:hypothetical protein
LCQTCRTQRHTLGTSADHLWHSQKSATQYFFIAALQASWLLRFSTAIQIELCEGGSWCATELRLADLAILVSIQDLWCCKTKKSIR